MQNTTNHFILGDIYQSTSCMNRFFDDGKISCDCVTVLTLKNLLFLSERKVAFSKFD